MEIAASREADSEILIQKEVHPSAKVMNHSPAARITVAASRTG
jgi:hypothetical protein